MNIFRKLFRQTIFDLLLKLGSIGLGIGVITIMDTPIAVAAEEVIFYYGVASQSVSVEELEKFAFLDKKSPALKFLFDFSQQNPQMARYVLNQEIPVEVTLLANVLNSTPGTFFLTETGKVIHPKSKSANVEALRGALIQSASDDNRISLLEFLQNYPTQQVYVDGTVFSKPFKPFNLNFL